MKKIVMKLMVFLFVFLALFFFSKRVFAGENDLELSNVSISEKSDTVEASIVSYNSDRITTNAVFHKVNDYIIYELIIKNISGEDYIIKSISDNNSSDYYKYEYDSHQNESFAKGSSKTIAVKVIYNKELTDISQRNQEGNVELKIVLEDKNGNEIIKNLSINPKTGDNILLFVLLGVVSLLGIAVVLSKTDKKTKVVLIAILISAPTFARAMSSDFVIIFDNSIKLNDKMVVTYILKNSQKQEAITYNTKITDPVDPTVAGYNFVNWTKDNSVYDFENLVTEDISLTANYTLIDYTIQYDLKDGSATNIDSYNVESDDFTLNAPQKQGYTFTGWTGSNGDTPQVSVTIPKGTTGNLTFTANYSPNQNTPYKVIHKYQNLDLTTYDEVEEDLTGETDSIVTPEFKSKEGFFNPSNASQLKIEADGSARLEYQYPRRRYYLNVNNYNYVEPSNVRGWHYFEEDVTLTAKDRDHYHFVKWSTGPTTKSITIKISEETTTVDYEPIYEIDSYDVTFDSNGGSDVATQSVDYNNKVTVPEEPEREGFIFVGWYSDSGLTSEFDFDNYKVTGPIKLYAKWDILYTCKENVHVTKINNVMCPDNENIIVGDGIVCKRATTLHQEKCTYSSYSSYYCAGAGYTTKGSKQTDTITYGNCGTSGSLNTGDAFTCDVDGDGFFNELSERFYYVSDYYNTSTKSFETDTATLIYYNNVTDGKACNKNIYNYDSSSDYYGNGPRDLAAQLPLATDWTNVTIKTNPRQIITQTGTNVLSFNYGTTAARLLTAQELSAACNITVGGYSQGELQSCIFMMENSNFSQAEVESSGYWLETLKQGSTMAFYVQGQMRAAASVRTTAPRASARPVIDVPKSKISY